MTSKPEDPENAPEKRQRVLPNPPDLHSLLDLPSSNRSSIVSEALSAYPRYVSSDLANLDEIRYTTIPALLQTKPYLSKQHLLDLMDWKLGHGKFRPALRGYIQSNPEKLIEEVTRRGIEILRQGDSKENIKAALTELTKLKGVGPATASLVLSCADPEGTVFFGDEVMEWVRPRPGEKLKYNVKEYMELWGGVREVKGTLGLTATEIEKVGYVFGKRLEENGKDEVMVVEVDAAEVEGSEQVREEKSKSFPEQLGNETISGIGNKKGAKRKAADDDQEDKLEGVVNEKRPQRQARSKKTKVDENPPAGTRKSTRSRKS